MSETNPTSASLKPFVKIGRARDCTGIGEHWSRKEVSPTVNLFDLGDTRWDNWEVSYTLNLATDFAVCVIRGICK